MNKYPIRNLEIDDHRSASLERSRDPMRSIVFPDLVKSRLPEPILEHAIRIRAYELYDQRGRVEGHALDDWLQAEAELLRRVVARDYSTR